MKNKESMNQIIKNKKGLELVYKKLDKALNYKKVPLAPVILAHQKFALQTTPKKLKQNYCDTDLLPSIINRNKELTHSILVKRSITPSPDSRGILSSSNFNDNITKNIGKVYKTSEKTICFYPDSMKLLIPRVKYHK